MERFTSFDGTEIAYLDEGDGSPVLLLHGFAADHVANWVSPKVVEALIAAGHRVVASDARGHGASGKPHDPRAYGDDAMVRDAQALLDHLGWDAVDLAGYSMGSVVSMGLAPVEPRVKRVILGGVGSTHKRTGSVTPSRFSPAMRAALADALETDDPSTIADATAKGFRMFADSTGADRLALAAMQRAEHLHDLSRIADIAVPTLVLTGDGDTLVGSPHDLAELIPAARAIVVKGDHLTAVGDPAFRRAIVDFFA